MSVDPNLHVPIYEQIVEHIRGSVAAGVHRPGEALPSIRALAVELLVNPNTVQRAYQELERQGLVKTRKGRGVFVTEDGDASAQSRSAAAVQARFTDGIQVGKTARLPDDRIESIFRNAMAAADGSEQTDRADARGDTSPEARDES